MDTEKKKYIKMLKKILIAAALWALLTTILVRLSYDDDLVRTRQDDDITRTILDNDYDDPESQPSNNISAVHKTGTDTDDEPAPALDDFLKKARSYAVDEKYRSALIEYKNALQLDPNNGEALLGASVCLMNLNDTKAALEYLEKALVVSPMTPEIYIMLADFNRRSGDTDSALSHISKAIELGTQKAEAFMLAGILHIEKTDLDSAEKYLKKAMDIKPDLLIARAYYARFLRLQGRVDEAKDLVSNILKAEPGQLEARLEQIVLSSKGQTLDSFNTEYEELIKERPNQRARILSHKMQTLFLMRNYDQALSTALKLISIRPNDSRAHRMCDSIYQRMGLFSNAIEHDQALLRLNVNDISTYQSLANAYISMGDNKSALTTANRGLMLSPDDFVLLILKGRALDAGEDYETALICYKKAADIKPDSPVPHTYMGRQHLALGAREEAIKCYERSLDIDPNAPIAANNLAVLLLAQDRDIDRAVKLSESLHKRFPTNAQMMDTLGWAYYKQGHVEKAIEKLSAANSLMPGHPSIMYHLAVVFDKKGSKENAVKYLEQALKSKVKFTEEEKARNLLEKLRQDS